MNIFEVIDKKDFEKRDIKEDFETFLNNVLKNSDYQYKYHNTRHLYRADDLMKLRKLDIMKDYLVTYPNVTNQDFEKMLSAKDLKSYKQLFDAYKKDFVKDIREHADVSYIFNAIDAETAPER